MEWSDTLPRVGPGPQVIVLAADEGDARDRLLDDWLRGARAAGRECLALDCDAERFGPFAGVEAWLLSLLPRMEDAAPDLIARHACELLKTIPRLRERYAFMRPTLVDSAPVDESVRGYAVERAFRIGQGLVDLLAAWHERSGASRLVVVADHFSRSGALVRRFFLDLVRRRAARLRLTVVFVVEPDTAAAFVERLESVWAPCGVRIPLPAGRRRRRSPQQHRQRALELERLAALRPPAAEIHLPEIICSWRQSDEPHRAVRWQAAAFALYTRYGYYEDAYALCDVVLDRLDELTVEFPSLFSRWTLVGSIFGCLVALGQAERAYHVVRTEGLEKAGDPADEARICYVLAMLLARFLPRHDFGRAEAYIERGLTALARSEAGEQVRWFLSAVLWNGLAFIRHRQGRALEAIRLCESGLAGLDEHLSRDSHRLERSVLLYRTGQVYASLRSQAKAIECFTAALEIDPDYAEYCNERGNMYLQMGRFDEAIADYRRAIEASPPYPEVWTNLGQCYRKTNDLEKAAEAYERALDLDPHVRRALAGHADVCVRTQRWDRALADYDALLSGDPDQPMVLANRAFVLGQLGRFEEAVDDLTRATRLAPNEAFLYEHRAAACIRLGRIAQVEEDLRALRLIQAGNVRPPDE